MFSLTPRTLQLLPLSFFMCAPKRLQTSMATFVSSHKEILVIFDKPPKDAMKIDRMLYDFEGGARIKKTERQ